MVNGVKDNNGNELPSFSEIRKRFDPKMTVTKLPANESRYAKSSVEQYLNQLKDCENGTVGYTKILSKDDKPVPVHLPYADKNGVSKWDTKNDFSISKTISEPVSLAKPSVEKNNAMSMSLTSKLPADRIASIKSQLDPNNPIGKILENSTVIHVENGIVDKKVKSSPEVSVKNIRNDIEKQVNTPKHTSNFASYIQISQAVSSTATPKKYEVNSIQESTKEKEPKVTKSKVNIKYIDSEQDNLLLNNDVESPSGTGFENKTFEHENFLKRRTEKDDDKIEENGVKSMETSTESTLSEATDDSSPETPSARRRLLDVKDYEDIKAVSSSFHIYLARLV